MQNVCYHIILIFIPPLPEGGGGYTVLRLSVLPSIQDIFRGIFLSNCWWQKSDIWSQASYRYTILWVAFLDPSDSYFLFADLVGFYAHWTYMHIFRHIFLSNYWWQRSDILSQASYRYPILWEVFLDSSDSYFLFAEERGYHRWALAHSSSCYFRQQPLEHWKNMELDHVVLEDSMELWVSSSIRTLKLRHKPTSLMLGLWSEMNIFNSYPWVFKASFIFVYTDYHGLTDLTYLG